MTFGMKISTRNGEKNWILHREASLSNNNFIALEFVQYLSVKLIEHEGRMNVHVHGMTQLQ